MIKIRHVSNNVHHYIMLMIHKENVKKSAKNPECTHINLLVNVSDNVLSHIVHLMVIIPVYKNVQIYIFIMLLEINVQNVQYNVLYVLIHIHV
jgi:hypothetical protein